MDLNQLRTVMSKKTYHLNRKSNRVTEVTGEKRVYRKNILYAYMTYGASSIREKAMVTSVT